MPQTSSPLTEWNFYWQAPSPLKAKSTYTLQKTAKPTPKPIPLASEPRIALEKLASEEKEAAQLMIRLGAHELSEGLSNTILKKAYRRLAKRLHPDMGTSVPMGSFIELQRAYEKLKRALTALRSSGSACGNESASEPGCPRQDAA